MWNCINIIPCELVRAGDIVVLNRLVGQDGRLIIRPKRTVGCVWILGHEYKANINGSRDACTRKSGVCIQLGSSSEVPLFAPSEFVGICDHCPYMRKD